MVILLEYFDDIQGFFSIGGDVLYGIMFVLLFMWTFIVERIWFIKLVHPSRMRAAVSAWDARADTTSWYAKQIRQAMISQVHEDLTRNINIVKTLIAICPLMGLLGTVWGMVDVFEVMALSGTGNARAMASGIYKATIPTMAGMVAALSGVYFSSYLDSSVDRETDKLEDLLQHH